jgi:hypothetical protein
MRRQVENHQAVERTRHTVTPQTPRKGRLNVG